MTASNHFIAGALIGASVTNPWLAAPTAFASHFLLDSLPQYGYEGPKELKRGGFTLFQWVLALDLLMFAISVWAITFMLNKPELIFFGLVAYSPDLIWLFKFTLQEKFGKRVLKNKNWFTGFHARIQKLEHPYLIVWEILFFIIIFSSLVWFAA